MPPDLRPLTGPTLDAALDDLARLRIAVFRDWPYLYDGDLDYERRYMESYRANPRAILVGAFDGTRLVGAATGTALADHAEEFAAPLAGTALSVETCFYCAESVLLPDYRGHGAGHGFFDLREAFGRDMGLTHSLFCAVIRPGDHPARPATPRLLEPFWRKRGYAPLPGAVARFSWRDVGATQETEKPLQIWARAL
jgi:GNAT superfamily N-acetyltransferase